MQRSSATVAIRKEHLVLRIPCFTDAAHPHCGLTSDGALGLANAATDTEVGFHVRLLDFDLLTLDIQDLDLIKPNRFLGRGAVLIAIDARAGIGPRQAAVFVEIRQAGFVSRPLGLDLGNGFIVFTPA